MDESPPSVTNDPDGPPSRRRRAGVLVPMPAVIVGLGLASVPALAQPLPPPIARDDFFFVPPNTSSELNVIGNDTLFGNVFSFCGIAPDPAHGNVSAKGSALLYVPFAGFEGVDQFQYCVANGPGCNACATVSLFVGDAAPAVPALSAVALAGLSSALGWLGLRARRRR